MEPEFHRIKRLPSAVAASGAGVVRSALLENRRRNRLAVRDVDAALCAHERIEGLSEAGAGWKSAS